MLDGHGRQEIYQLTSFVRRPEYVHFVIVISAFLEIDCKPPTIQPNQRKSAFINLTKEPGKTLSAVESQ